MFSRIVIIDKSIIRAKQLKQLLEQDFIVTHYSALSGAADYLTGSTPAMVIIDTLSEDNYKELNRLCGEIPVLEINGPSLWNRLTFPAEANSILKLVKERIYHTERSMLLSEDYNNLKTRLVRVENENEMNKRYMEKAGRAQQHMMKTKQYPDTKLDIFAHYMPLMTLGGDFYYYKLFDDDFYFCIGDVCDHGTEAAIYMTKMYSFLVALLQTEPDFYNLIKHFDALARTYNPDGMTATVWFGVLNLTTNKLRYANFGHEEPVVYDSGDVYPLQTDYIGTPIGINSEQRISIKEIDLPKGAKLFLYTDGLTEEFNSLGMNAKDAYGTERLFSTMKEIKPESNAKEVCDLVLDDVRQYSAGVKQHDDLLLLCIDTDRKGE